ncbi:MAG TPA: MFS transporter, partial [Thermoanaerobaculia bacterium]|nr:MFS transporter [Thermoanaerobaculia bacterium]
VALATIGLFGSLIGTFAGGVLTEVMGLGRALWLFGFLQLTSNAGYILLAHFGGVDRTLMYSAVGFEMVASGLGSGAFSVLLLRMTQKRFSATQYALFSSLFGLPRLVAGPICGFLVHAVGWETFFWLTLPFGIPGMVILARFVPWGVKDPVFTVEPAGERAPLQPGDLLKRGLLGGVLGTLFGFLTSALLTALRILKDEPEKPFDLIGPLRALVAPQDPGGWITLIGLLAFGAVCGLFTAAITAARRGAGRELAEG